MQHKLPFHFDMETADPDDSMTLAVLATHPKVHLVSVSVHPGGTRPDWCRTSYFTNPRQGRHPHRSRNSQIRSKPCF